MCGVGGGAAASEMNPMKQDRIRVPAVVDGRRVELFIPKKQYDEIVRKFREVKQ